MNCFFFSVATDIFLFLAVVFDFGTASSVPPAFPASSVGAIVKLVRCKHSHDAHTLTLRPPGLYSVVGAPSLFSS